MSTITRPISVAYILTPIEFGGSEKVSITFLRNYDKTKYRITPIVLIRPWEDPPLFVQKLQREHFAFHQVPVATRPLSEGRDYLRIIRCYRIIYSILKNGRFDLVHTHGYFADIIGIIAAKTLHLSSISTCHGFISNNFHYKLYNIMDRAVLRLSDKIIAVSDPIKKQLVKSGINGERIFVAQNAVDSIFNGALLRRYREETRHCLHIQDEDVVVGYVGRLSAEKGLKYLIKALPFLKSTSNIRLLIIGDGPERGELEELATKEGIQSKVIFGGFQPDVERWIPSMDIFVLPSLTEGTPMALLEAMSFGVPVIATKVGGVPSVISDGRNGILVASADPIGLAEKIHILVENPILRKSIAVSSMDTIQKSFNLNDWCRKIESQYVLLASGKV